MRANETSTSCAFAQSRRTFATYLSISSFVHSILSRYQYKKDEFKSKRKVVKFCRTFLPCESNFTLERFLSTKTASKSLTARMNYNHLPLSTMIDNE